VSRPSTNQPAATGLAARDMFNGPGKSHKCIASSRNTWTSIWTTFELIRDESKAFIGRASVRPQHITGTGWGQLSTSKGANPSRRGASLPVPWSSSLCGRRKGWAISELRYAATQHDHPMSLKTPGSKTHRRPVHHFAPNLPTPSPKIMY